MDGYEVLAEGRVAELDSNYRRLRHSRSGAEILSFENRDENKVFGVTLRTPPVDATGLAHIMEHSVLCGSKRFPVKEPFVELLKGSLKTFLNAFTYPDKTCYPVASQNVQDLLNLARVYLDAVFFPLIPPEVLQQEGWRFEPAGQDDLEFKGVVFNEMKGAYADPLGLVYKYSQELLFPDTVYRFDAGGDPREIPSLTYPQFKRFHETYYHPSNALVFIWGDAGHAACLELLDEYLHDFSARPPLPAIEVQAPWRETRRVQREFDAGDAVEHEKRAMVVMSWLFPETADAVVMLSLDVLAYILVGSAAAPLRKALIDSALGETLVGGGLHSELRQPFFATGLKGIREQDADAVEALILETLSRLAAEGIDPKMRDAALNVVEFGLRENNTGGFPQGLACMLTALVTWLHGRDPLAWLAYEAPLAAVKAAAGQPGYFEDLIRSYFLENQSRARVLLAPAAGYAERREAEERDRLRALKEAMSEEELRAVKRSADQLRERQRRPDAAAALAQLPVLRLSDLERKQKEVPCDRLRAGAAPLLCHDLPTHGIAYLDLAFDLRRVPAESIPLAPMFCRALLEMGTRREDFASLSQRIDRETGGIGASPWVSSRRQSDQAAALILIRGKATVDNFERLCAILREVLLELALDRPDRFLQIVRQRKAGLEAAVVPAGNQLAAMRAGAAYSQAGWANERMHGLSQIFAMRELEQQVAQNWSGVLASFEGLREALVDAGALRFNLTVEGQHLARCQAGLADLAGALPLSRPAACTWPGPQSPQAEGFIIPAPVHYVAKYAALYESGFSYHGALEAVIRHLNTKYLWDRVRVEGGAYGCGCSFNRLSGIFGFSSYRDPNFRKTVEIYDRTADYLEGLILDEAELTKSIIGAVGAIDAYQLPDAKGFSSFVQHELGITAAERQRIRDELFAADLGGFRRLGEALRRSAPRGNLTVLGPESTLAGERERLQVYTVF